MGRSHLEAIERLGQIEVAAVCGRRADAASDLAAAFGVERSGTDLDAVLDDPSLNAVHICTPNSAHAPMVSRALEAGKHVLCEKPLAMSSQEASQLVEMARERGLRNCTCHNLRYYPLVQQMRRMCAAGELGEIRIVEGGYSQDWLLYDSDWNWRVDPDTAGRSRALADIGSHWCDMAEHVTGQRISSLVADLGTFHRTRQRPEQSVETFTAKASTEVVDVRPFAVESEDYAAVLFQMGEKTRGSFSVSQVSPGRKNRLAIAIYGTLASVAWDQEQPNRLWIGRRDAPNQVLQKDPGLMAEEAASFADYPAGHTEGYPDTFKQVFRRFYDSISDPGAAPEYPQFADGHRQLRVVEAALESHRTRSWLEVKSD
jgi:predicted dehydrogenase